MFINNHVALKLAIITKQFSPALLTTVVLEAGLSQTKYSFASLRISTDGVYTKWDVLVQR